MKRNLNRYHRDIFLPETFPKQMEELIRFLNRHNWLFGFHAIKKLLKTLDKETAEQIVSFIYHYRIKIEDVFEVYYYKGSIEKFCIRVSFNETLDLILVISKEKTIVTLFVNFKDHQHENLDKTLYIQGEKSE